MKVTAIRTRKFLPPKDDLLSLIKESFSNIKLQEKSVVVITSKIVSIWQGRCKKITGKAEKYGLIKKEADYYLDKENTSKKSVMLTIKEGLLIPTAGIDESNANGYYVFWPEKPFLAAKQIREFLKKTYKLKKLGIIISDSHLAPLRTGVLGIGIAYWGFEPLKDYRGKKDIFGRTIQLAQANIVDSLAAAAVFEMGEGNEQRPIAIVEDISDISFKESNFSKNNPLLMDKEYDIYSSLIKSVKWQKE